MGLRHWLSGVTPGERNWRHMLFVAILLVACRPSLQLTERLIKGRKAASVKIEGHSAHPDEAKEPRVLLVWHPMKTGGTTLCMAMLEHPGLLEERHRSNATYMKALHDYNCRLTHDEGIAMQAVTGVRYYEHDLPTEGHVPLLPAVTGRSFFFLEPSYTNRHKFVSWTLPPFLSPDSAAWSAYHHVFLIRSPLERAWSALHHFKLHEACGLDSAAEFVHLHAAYQLPTGDPKCDEAARIANGAFGNFYIRHLTGHPDALSLAKTRLGSMEVIELAHSDQNCTQRQIKQLFEIAELQVPGSSPDNLQEQRRQRVLEEQWSWGVVEGGVHHREAQAPQQQQQQQEEGGNRDSADGDEGGVGLQSHRVNHHAPLEPGSPAARLLASRMRLDIELYEWHLQRRQQLCQQL